MDAVYDLPYARTWHPSYDEEGGVPAIQEVRFSLVSNRGCFGGCSFCALTFHQGRRVQVRSHESILREAEQMSRERTLRDTFTMWAAPRQISGIRLQKADRKGRLQSPAVPFPEACPNLDSSHSDYMSLLKKLRQIPGVKKVFIRSVPASF